MGHVLGGNRALVERGGLRGVLGAPRPEGTDDAEAIDGLLADLKGALPTADEMRTVAPFGNLERLFDRLNAMGETLRAIPPRDGEGEQSDRKPPGAPVPDLPGDNRKRRLAPNGKPSNLNARQHAQVRTPQFKRYFGDWETLAKRNALESMPAISVDTSPFGSERNAKALRVVGSAEFDKLVSSHGTRAKAVINRTDGKRIIFARGQFGKPESHSADTRIMRLIPGLPDLLEAAVPLYETPEINPQKHPNIRGWHTYGSKAILDGQELYVQLTTFELHDGTEVLSEYHDHNVTWAEAMEKGQLAGPDPITNRAVTQADLSRNNLYQWWHSVNAETVSKVVDENGEPLVVWHGGTDADIFKASETTPSFFTPNYEDARRYARASTYRGQPGALRAFFLNIRNPREEPLFYDHKRGAGVARNAADGVIVAGGEGFAVWTPNQIKSATENSGEFSKENPSILGAPVPDPQGEDDESAIDDLLADLSSDLPSAAELRAMLKYHGQEQPGEFTVGDPARANYGTTEDVRRRRIVALIEPISRPSRIPSDDQDLENQSLAARATWLHRTDRTLALPEFDVLEIEVIQNFCFLDDRVTRDGCR